MNKRAVDLSLEELAAMGANAALQAANEARDAGLTVVGGAEVRLGDKLAPALMQRHPSGIVTLLDSDPLDKSAGVNDSGESEIATRGAD